jgi:hypothetical protein
MIVNLHILIVRFRCSNPRKRGVSHYDPDLLYYPWSSLALGKVSNERYLVMIMIGVINSVDAR